ncbi:MAG: transglutaminase-like domain-containing protein [Planctomycetota bacterium]|nr:transglutaminase-like domain-containing protein [Planctomycetota bacterium]
MRFEILLGLTLFLSPCLALGQTAYPTSPAAGTGGGGSSPLATAAIAAVESGDLSSLADSLDRQAKTALENVRGLEPISLARLAAYREFAHFFGVTKDLPAPQKETLKWLAAREKLLETLMSAVTPRESSREILDRLTQFHADSIANCEAYPDLVTALLVVPNLQPYHQILVTMPDENNVLRLFHYFANPNSPVRFNMRDLPWQLAVYVVDIKVSPSDMMWAVDRYFRKEQIGSTYFDVPYDTSAYLNGGARQIESRPYSLPNLLQFGGVCIDQAYYATQIAKTMGIPACICVGEGGAGQAAHAWVGFLEVNNRRAKWNFEEGRYKEFLFWSAQIVDPQTQEALSDADVGLLAELQNVTPQARLESTLILREADLIDDAQRMDFYTKVIDLSPGNRQAWVALANVAAEGKLTISQSDKIAKVVSKYAVKNYPDFAFAVLVRMARGTTGDQRIQALGRIGNFFTDRPDLLARIRILQGNLLQEDKKYNDAMVAYGDVLTHELNAGPIIMQAMRHVDEIMRTQNDLPRLAKIYSQVWRSLPVPDTSSFAAHTPFYEMGQTYALLSDEIGNTAEANSVRARLSQLLGGSKPVQ